MSLRGLGLEVNLFGLIRSKNKNMQIQKKRQKIGRTLARVSISLASPKYIRRVLVR